MQLLLVVYCLLKSTLAIALEFGVAVEVGRRTWGYGVPDADSHESRMQILGWFVDVAFSPFRSATAWTFSGKRFIETSKSYLSRQFTRRDVSPCRSNLVCFLALDRRAVEFCMCWNLDRITWGRPSRDVCATCVCMHMEIRTSCDFARLCRHGHVLWTAN